METDNNLNDSENILTQNKKNKVYMLNNEIPNNIPEKEKNNSKNKNIKVKKNNKRKNLWPYKILVLTFFLTLFFSMTSELVLSTAGIVISILIIVIFLVIAIFADMLGVAITCSSSQNFQAMASKKVKGSKEALFLIKNTDKFASLCNDVIGDFCGILSGAAGAAITVKLILAMSIKSHTIEVLVASLVSSLVAGITVFGKALGKTVAIEKSEKIVLMAGRFLSFFKRNKK